MELQHRNERAPVPEPSEIESLEDVRTTLAGDVVQFLAVVAPTSGIRDTASLTNAVAPSGQRQVLLRAAVADLQATDERLHHARG